MSDDVITMNVVKRKRSSTFVIFHTPKKKVIGRCPYIYGVMVGVIETAFPDITMGTTDLSSVIYNDFFYKFSKKIPIELGREIWDELKFGEVDTYE